MAKYLVQKSNPLSGEVEISGAKNAVLPIMAAALLSEEECTLFDVPALRDVDVLTQLLTHIGAVVKKADTNTLNIYTPNINTYEAPFELVKKMRASFLVAGPMLARTGHARVYMPGGCTIGARPVELHLKGFQAMGAEIINNEIESFVEMSCDRLQGASIYLDFPSVGATENIMMAAVLAEGTTIIENAAEEPEIVDLANFLNKMGARVKGAGTETIKIEGVEKLGGCKHGIIPDRIETGTFMVAAAITRGEILIKNAVPDHVKAITAKLIECGVVVEKTDEGLLVKGNVNPLVSTNIKTMPYPGFPTDLHPQFAAMMCRSNGSCEIEETLFENRYKYIEELKKTGGNIEVFQKKAIIKGVPKLCGAHMKAPDLRGGAALVTAAICACGESVIDNTQYIQRGYCGFDETIRSLGGDIWTI